MESTKHMIVHFPVFDYAIRVEIGDISTNLKRHRKEIGEMYVDSLDVALSVHVDDDLKSFIFLTSDSDAGTVAHEAWHCVSRMLEASGAELDDEVVAYHLGYLVRRIQTWRGK